MRATGSIIVVGQSFDLVDVEDRIGLEERDAALDFITALVGLGPGELAGIDDGGAGLAFSDMTAKLDRLLERHPDGRGEAARERLRP
jgi:hypothetical protein